MNTNSHLRKPAAALLATALMFALCAAGAWAVPKLSTSLASGDPKLPLSTFTVKVALSDNTTTYELMHFHAKVKFDVRKVDFVGAAFPAAGFGGNEGPALIPAAGDKPTSDGVIGWRRIAAADLSGTSTVVNGDVMLLTFKTTQWPALPLSITIEAPGQLLGNEAETLIFQTTDGAIVSGFPTSVVFNNTGLQILGGADGDRDKDGFPDAIEVTVLHTDPDNANQPDRTDPYFADVDGDGLPDGMDPNTSTADLNGDGYPDGRDSDGDLYSDGYEAGHGFDPNNAASHPSLGDLNGDGRITNLDIIRLAQYVAGRDLSAFVTYYGNMDINLSGTITNVDIIRLAQFYAKRSGRGILP